MRGSISLSNSNHLPAIVGSRLMKPVTLPPGRGKFATKPLRTGSTTFTKMIGMARVCCNIAAALQALMEARRAAASRGPLVRYVEPIQGNHQVEKLTHCSACFENDWRFCGSAFCTPTSSPQVRRHVAGKRVHPHVQCRICN